MGAYDRAPDRRLLLVAAGALAISGALTGLWSEQIWSLRAGVTLAVVAAAGTLAASRR